MNKKYILQQISALPKGGITYKTIKLNIDKYIFVGCIAKDLYINM